MEYTDKLAQLTRIPEWEKLSRTLFEIQENHYIAGGSICNILCPNKRNIPGDIDIFVTNRNEIGDIVKKLRQCYESNKPIIYRQSSSYERASVIDIPCGSTPLQLIFIREMTIMDLLDSFDEDFVQCGLYKGQIYRTEDCVYSHERKLAHRVRSSINDMRLRKIWTRGFLPLEPSYSYEPDECKSIVFDPDKSVDILTPFYRDLTNSKMVDIYPLVVQKIIGDTVLQYDDSEYSYTMSHIQYKLGSTDIQITSKYIAVHVDILEMNEHTHRWGSHFRTVCVYSIKPIYIGDIEITKMISGDEYCSKIYDGVSVCAKVMFSNWDGVFGAHLTDPHKCSKIDCIYSSNFEVHIEEFLEHIGYVNHKRIKSARK